MPSQGMRYPTLAFITGGTGQADEGIPPQPFETFCYDTALVAAKIENFNILPYTSVLPKELYGHIVTVDRVADQFHHGAVLEVIMSGNGTEWGKHKAIATGLGIAWAEDARGTFVGGFAAEYVQYFGAHIDDATADADAKSWLTKSLHHELRIRGLRKRGDFEFHHHYLNITHPFGYCLTVMGFLNFEYAPPAKPR